MNIAEDKGAGRSMVHEEGGVHTVVIIPVAS